MKVKHVKAGGVHALRGKDMHLSEKKPTFKVLWKKQHVDIFLISQINLYNKVLLNKHFRSMNEWLYGL